MQISSRLRIATLAAATTPLMGTAFMSAPGANISTMSGRDI